MRKDRHQDAAPMIDLELPGDLSGDRASTRVVVAMSGGVDSSVVAGLVKEAGYDTVGITLQLYDHGAAVHKAGACCAGQDIHDARRVAETLGIPHYVLDYESRFRSDVIDRFADSYIRGETPIPCVSCNQTVKFRDLLTMARDLGADALVTGHYIASRGMPDGGRVLHRAADLRRDQSYFLFATTPEQARFLRFPLGDMEKDETRAHARRFGLPVAEKSDSQDICFVPSGDYASVIGKLRPEALAPGRIVHLDGRDLGEHAGVIHYTIGQRRGLGVATGDPLYVVGLDPAGRQVIVGPREALRTTRVMLRDINWLGEDTILQAARSETEVGVRVRSTRPPVPASLIIEDGAPVVLLHNGEEGVSPGQACVIYDSEAPRARLLGGGFIAGTDRTEALAGNAGRPAPRRTLIDRVSAG
jgi:tRNA-specific 2-thiouridylase